MSKHRTVEVYSMVWNTDLNKYKKEFICNGIFHQFSIGIDVFESMEVQVPVAIIELDDGTVMSLPLHLIKFIK